MNHDSGKIRARPLEVRAQVGILKLGFPWPVGPTGRAAQKKRYPTYLRPILADLGSVLKNTFHVRRGRRLSYRWLHGRRGDQIRRR